MKRAFSRWFSF